MSRRYTAILNIATKRNRRWQFDGAAGDHPAAMNMPDIGDSSPEAVGVRLLVLRVATGFEGRQQRAFADHLGFGVTRWNNYESGRQMPPVDVALKICRKTGATLDWIYRGIEDLMPYHLVIKMRDLSDVETGKRLRP